MKLICKKKVLNQLLKNKFCLMLKLFPGFFNLKGATLKIPMCSDWKLSVSVSVSANRFRPIGFGFGIIQSFGFGRNFGFKSNRKPKFVNIV
jgi:hypothetical protein